MKSFVLLLFLILPGLNAFANQDGLDFLETEDESIIVHSMPLTDIEPNLTAKDSDRFRAKVVAIINKSENYGGGQTLRVYQDGKIIYKWLVSTGREKLETAVSGKVYRTITPLGYFRPYRLVELHRSATWNSDMPYSVFFKGGVATHEGHNLEKLGTRASGGCVRLSAESAKLFFELVKHTGISKVTEINRDGTDHLDETGLPVEIDAYNVLIIVENPISSQK